MKTSHLHKRIFSSVALLVAAASFALTGTSCTTTYDAYGRPHQTVDPGVAVAGAAAAGLAGYAVGRDRGRTVRHRHYSPAPRRYYHTPRTYYRY